MTDLAVGDFTVTINDRRISEAVKYVDLSLAFGDSALTYPAGGVPLPTVFNLGLRRNINQLIIYDPANANGYVYKYDYTNHKLRVYQGAAETSEASVFTGVAAKPQLVTEEVQVIASHVGTLTYVPFYVIAIEATAGGTTGPANIVPVGETPATHECAVNLLTGGMTFNTTDAVTSARITYIPLQLAGPFVEANRVVDEAVVAAAAKATLANQACAVQYVYDDTDSAIHLFEPVGEAPSATHKAVIDIDAGSSDTNIDSHADDEGNALKVTYIKYSALKAVQCVGDTDVTITGGTAEQYGWGHDAEGGYHSLVVPGLGTQLVAEEGANNVTLIWSGPSASAGAGVPVWNPYKNYVTTDEATAITTLNMPWFVLEPASVADETPAGTNSAIGTEAAGALAEVTGVALAAATLRCQAVGW